MDYIAQPKDYWIAQNAIHISLNALGDANRIQCSVASGAVIMCYIYGTANDGLGYDNGHQYRTWPIVIAPTYFNSNTVKYVYAAIPKNQAVGTTAMVVFPSEQLDIYGKNASNEQIGSTDYFFIWLQGIISEVRETSNTLERQPTQDINYGLLDTDQARDAKIDDTAWYSYSHLTEIVTFLKEIVMNVGSSFRNIFLGPDGGKELTSVATDSTTPTNSTTAVVTPAYGLSKVKRDNAKEIITFEKGAEFGEFVEDASGAGIWKDENDNWHVEGDYLHARKKLVAKEVQIEDVHHVGGQQLLTAASMTADFVVEKENVYRCFFRKIGDDGKEVYNKWRVNDQAYVCTFNLKVQNNHTGGDGDKVGNHYLWRLVTATSNETSDNGTYDVNGEMVDASEYHFIDLSKTICDSMSDAPLAGDDIVQLGHQGDDIDRQNAIILAGAGTASPYIREFTHIISFHLPAPETQLKPGDNLLSGIVKMTAGSKLPDGSDVSNTIGGLVSGQEALREDVDTLDTGNENLLRNTGFTGDYESDEVQETTEVDGDTEMWSPRLKYWEGSGVDVVTNVNSTTGMAATLTSGMLRQTVSSSIEYGEPMCISVKCYGTAIAISFGGYSEAITPTDNPRRYIIKMNVLDASQTDFVLQGTGTVMEIMLTRGKIPNADWIPSPLDNDKSVAYFQNLSYLVNAITNADTNILGGLILTQMIRVGNYRNGEMSGETGGMSGIWTSDKSPFLWGGGDMEQAFYTIGKYANDPSYQATEEEVAQMAKFVVTHGGRAILNDIVLRGYIYALGGYFKGEVHADSGVFNGTVNATSGNFRNITSPNGAFSITNEGNLECQDARIKGSIYNPLFVIDDTNGGLYLPIYDDGQGTTYYQVALNLTGLNIMLKLDTFSLNSYIQLPCDNAAYDGAKAHIMNNCYQRQVTVHGSVNSLMNQYTLDSGQIGIYYCVPVGGGVYTWVELLVAPPSTI